MAKTATKEQQYEDLQNRLQLMEGERKATFQSMSHIINQNKETIRHLKGENRNLRSMLGELRTDTLPDEGTQCSRKMDELSRSKLRLDQSRNETARLHRRLRELQDKLVELEMNAQRPTSDDSPHLRHIRVLENRLDKAMIKFNEAQSIRKTYEQIVRRLRDERVSFDHQLAALERALQGKERDLEELLLLSHDAGHAKEMAQAELHRFEQSVIDERRQREKEVAEKRALVQARVDFNQKLEQREREAKKKAEIEKAQETRPPTATGVSETRVSALAEEEEERRRLADYAEAFRRVKEATGVSDVNEVIQKFLTQADTQKNLVQLTHENSGRIEELQAERARLRAHLDELKYSSGAGERRRQAADDLEAQVVEANQRYERARMKVERIMKVLVAAKAGIEHLHERVDTVPIDGEQTVPPGSITDDKVEEALGAVNVKLQRLLELTQMDTSRPPQNLMDTSDIPEETLAKTLKNNIRITLPTAEADDAEEDEEVEEDVDEEVHGRSSIKHSSVLILEQQQKKLRKKTQKGPGK